MDNINSTNHVNIFTKLLSLFKCSHCDHSNCLFSAIRALRNGLYYGGKIRLIHSIVMQIIMGNTNDKIFETIYKVIKPSLEHSLNLGLFAFIFKAIVCLLNRIFSKKLKIFHFIAGVIAAFFIWRKNTPVTSQIMLYLLSRNIAAISFMIKRKYFPNFQNGFSWTSILVWGTVMFLFEYDSSSMQSSLSKSMQFIYKDSDVFTTWRDFIPFYV